MTAPLADPSIVASSPCCIQCGYDIASLPSPGRCPECGLDFGVSIVLEGVARVSHGMSTYRKLAWAIVVVAAIVLWLGMGFLILLNPIVAFAAAASTLGGMLALFATGARERRGKEQFILTTHGVGRLPIPKFGQRVSYRQSEVDFTPWIQADVVRLDPVSRVWCRVRIGAVSDAENGIRAIEFDAGFRCPGDMLENVLQALESIVVEQDNSRQVAEHFYALPGGPPPIPSTETGVRWNEE